MSAASDYVRVCPVCGAAAPAAAAQCGQCGSLLLGVDLSLPAPPAAPPEPDASTLAAAPAAAPAGAIPCPHADCGAPNPPGGDACLYCGRPLAGMPAVAPAPTLFALPAALADKFRIAEVLPAGGAEAEILVLAGLNNPAVKVAAKLYRPGIVPNGELLERVAQAGFGHVVRLIARGVSDGIHYEILEYCPAGSLRRLMQAGPLRRDELRLTVAELAEALAALHGIDVIHRDLKPENILIRRREPLDLVLTDFGVAALLDATQHFTTMARSLRYGAPETLAGVVDRAADWWSLGMILVELLVGRHPFAGLSDAVVAHRLVTAGIDLSEVDDPDWRTLCAGLLLRDPRRRWGAAEIRRWLAGDATLPAPQDAPAVPSARTVQPYRLGDALCHSPAELAAALAAQWEAGRKDLQRGQLADWVGKELKDQNLLRFLHDLRELRDVSDDLRLLKLIVHLAPGLPPVWRGQGMAVAPLLAQAARAEQGDAPAGEWLAALFAQRALEELAADRHPDEAALATRWAAAGERLREFWRRAARRRSDWRQAENNRAGYADMDALMYGRDEESSLPPASRLHPPLLLACADAAYAAQLRARLRTEAQPYRDAAPWLAELLDSDEPAAWVAVRFLLPGAVAAAEAAQQDRRRAAEAETAHFAEIARRTNETLGQLREACASLGLFADAVERNHAALACRELLALLGAAQAAGVPLEHPLLRTLRRAEPVALRIQDRLDAWEHAARVNALWRNRRLAEGVGGMFFLAFMFAAQVLARFLFWLMVIPAAIFLWRLRGIARLRETIRELGRSLPARTPKE